MRRGVITRLVAATALLMVVISVPAASAANPWRKSKPWNISHQGGEGEFPGNTLYALKKSLRAGADMLELDIGVTKDGRVVMHHNTTVDARTNGTGEVRSFTLKQIQRLDNAYWFSDGPDGISYSQDKPVSTYKFRGIATGKKKPPRGFKASDFRVASLREVLRAFPKTPINLEIKGRTPAEETSEYIQNARALARELKNVKRRNIIVVSFRQEAVDEFHRLAPKIPIAPGVEGMAAFLLFDVLPARGTVALQPPILYEYPGLGLVTVSSTEYIEKAHAAGYAWQNWFSDHDSDSTVDWQKMVDRCSDGIMTAYPVALEAFLKATPSPSVCSERP
jgi:glycerophosphoryl diester phosphodiesterase